MNKEQGIIRKGMKLTPSEWKALEKRIKGVGWAGYIRSLIIADMGSDFPDNIVGAGRRKAE